MQVRETPPFAPVLMESTRAIGYSLEAAIADIIDNSIAAKAGKVQLFFFPVDDAYVCILDDGSGMDNAQIDVAMQYGSKSPTDIRDASDLGRYGLGLKTASLSQCRVLTVVSKQGNTVIGRRWDLDYVIETGTWSLLILDEDDIEQVPHITDLKEQENGTLVVWQNLDRLLMGELDYEKSLGRKMDDVRQHLGLVFHRYLSGEAGIKRLEIFFNGVKIKAADPFLLKKSTQAMDTETLIIRGKKILVKPYILPHISKMTEEEKNQLGGKETKSFIQIIHRFRDEALTTNNPPAEKVAIFDEAQRAWNEESLTDFMKRKKGVDAFNQSEPEFLIRIMDRHQDWAVIVCLVGGGQEIYNGEAGIIDWFRALQKKFRNWHIYLSDNITDSEYVGNSSIEELLTGCSYSLRPALHLGVSLRSFRSEKLAEFVKLLLDNEPSAAAAVYSELSIHYPIILTRDLDKAKEWIHKKARGTERYRLLASSEGKRLRGIGIWVPSVINPVGWFLNEKDDVDSSYFFEVAASEFKVQGLEIDYSILAWDADLRRSGKGFDYFKFRGTRWNHVNNMQQQKYLKNAYRVLMTRARQGMIIFVPSGTDPEDDPTRDSAFYDDIYKYLRSCGIKELM